jgi:hypothetical protein
VHPDAPYYEGSSLVRLHVLGGSRFPCTLIGPSH